ncbi:alkane 1-monooxygenase [Roseovarius sp. S4756]|uniref:alkane 1-monooxygenase n=1 Tax=Roseovarius maritimus TaxID=3342637 RepID=UPI003727B57B
MIFFACATLAPMVMILAGTVWGGAWPYATLAYMTALSFVVDRLIASAPDSPGEGAEFPGAPRLLALLGVLHFIVLGAAVWAVAGQAGLSWPARISLGISAGLVFGQIGHPAAHELIHKRPRALRLLGRLVYSSLLVGHHASAHLLVHHVHVASDSDPNSARRGEGFYRFALRAGLGGLRAGWRAEAEMLRRAARPLWRHPYGLYVAVGIGCLGIAAALGGIGGVIAYVAMCLYAQMQILMSDYVQHYGLRRERRPNGTLEPVGPGHSWNAPHRFSSALTLNAPRHSHHHVAPGTEFPALCLTRQDMPMLPYPLPAMAALSLTPTLWRRVMDRRLDRWEQRLDQTGDIPRPAA